MVKLTNALAYGLGLPLRDGPGGERRSAFLLRAGESIEVPEWYVDELRLEEGPAARLERGELVVTIPPAPKVAPVLAPSEEGKPEIDPAFASEAADIAGLNAADAIEMVGETESAELLVVLHDVESAGKGRKTVLEAIRARQEALATPPTIPPAPNEDG